MTTKIVLTKGTLGVWYCDIESDNGKGDFGTDRVNVSGFEFDREELLVKAVSKLGIEVQFIVDGKEVK
jgi:hypothetical protein